MMATKHPAKSAFHWKSPTGMALIGLLAIAAIYLLIEHTVHLLVALPWLILVLFCLLMHFFMHGKPGYGGHGDGEE